MVVPSHRRRHGTIKFRRTSVANIAEIKLRTLFLGGICRMKYPLTAVDIIDIIFFKV